MDAQAGRRVKWIQLLIQEQVKSTRAYIRNVPNNAERKLTLNAEVPDVSLRIMKVRGDGRNPREWIRSRRDRRQRTRRVGKAAPTGSRAESRDADRVRRRSDGIAQNVVEVDVVADSEAATKNCAVLAEQPAAPLRRVSKTETRGEVVLIALDFTTRQQRHTKSAESRKRRRVLRHAVKLVTQAEVQCQIWPHAPVVVDEVSLVDNVRMVVVGTKHFRRKRSLSTGEVIDEVAKGRKRIDRTGGRVVRKRERTTRVDGHELFR